MEAYAVLVKHNWPGNVREFKHEMERALAISNNHDTITPSNFSDRIHFHDKGITVVASLKNRLNEFEKMIIFKTLNEHLWNKKKVADILGITQQWLNKRIHHLNIDRR